MKEFKKTLAAGLVVLVPIAVTVWVLKSILWTVDGLFLPWLRAANIPIPNVFGIGILATVFIVWLCGLAVRKLPGKKAHEAVSSFLMKVPVVKSIYSVSRDAMETMMGDGKRPSKVVMITYPSEGTKAIAFVVNEVVKNNIPYNVVYVPTSPNPTSGFVLLVPPSDCEDAGMTMEEATKAILSGGYVMKADDNKGKVTDE